MSERIKWMKWTIWVNEWFHISSDLYCNLLLFHWTIRSLHILFYCEILHVSLGITHDFTEHYIHFISHYNSNITHYTLFSLEYFILHVMLRSISLIIAYISLSILLFNWTKVNGRPMATKGGHNGGHRPPYITFV